MRNVIFILLTFAIISLASGQEYRNGDHELLIMPTAYTMPQGSSYFTDYELFFLNYSYGITDKTHLGAFMLFPIVSEAFETISVGVKQNYYQGEKFAGALFGSYTFKEGFATFGNVFSIGNRNANVHFGIGGIIPKTGAEPEALYMIGAKAHTSKNFALLGEYTNMQEGFDNDFGGLFSIGARFVGETLAWDFGGIRPLNEDTGDFIFFPYVKVTVFFE